MEVRELTPGRATPEGTGRFAGRFADRPGHFRRPDRLFFSSLALGLRNGEPGGVDDWMYRAAVDSGLEGGLNVFVTALSERSQTSERCLGGALATGFREALAARDEVIVATKGGYLTLDPVAVSDRRSARDYVRETYFESGLVQPDRVIHGVHCLDGPFLRDQIERSRRNLGLETLDLYLLEEPEIHLGECTTDEFARRLREAFETLERAVADGSIAAYGLCTWDGFLRPHSDREHLSLIDMLEWAMDVGGPDHHLRAVQLPFNATLTEALHADSQIAPTGRTGAVLETLHGTGTAVLASAPLARGRLLGQLPRRFESAFPGLDGDAQRSLQLVRSTPEITTAVVGMREPDHVDENLALTRLAPAERETLEALMKPDGDA